MKAIATPRYGGPETIEVIERPCPEPRKGEVLIAVEAAALNSWDWDNLRGVSPPVRLLSPLEPPYLVPGADVAGTVAAVGPDVPRFKPGDRVFGDLSAARWGAFAQYAIAPAHCLAHCPDGLALLEAAALPQAGVLALQGFGSHQALRKGDRVLINGAGGGVGTFAIQLAKTAGAHVVAIDSASKQEAMRALGADQVLDYRQCDLGVLDQRFDLILEAVARHRLGTYETLLAPSGTLVVIGGTMRALVAVGVLGRWRSKKTGKRLSVLVHTPNPDDLTGLAERVVAGALKPVIDSVYRLEEAPEAYRRLGAGEVVGKIVFAIGETARAALR